MKHAKTLGALVAVSATAIVLVACNQEPAAAQVEGSRYSAEVFVTGISTAYAITDHQANKYYVYSNEKDEKNTEYLRLSAIVDLAQCGQERIDVTVMRPPAEQEPAQRQ